jgi:hypothetical protein
MHVRWIGEHPAVDIVITLFRTWANSQGPSERHHCHRREPLFLAKVKRSFEILVLVRKFRGRFGRCKNLASFETLRFMLK